MTGVELIAKERQEQIEKHGFTIAHDEQINPGNELLQASQALLFGTPWPLNWNQSSIEHLEGKLLCEKVVIVGAWMAAWCDSHTHEFPFGNIDGKKTFPSEELTSGITDLRYEVADQDYECNASLFIKDCLEDILPDLTTEQKIAVNKAKANNWQVKKGERCRRYVWGAGTDEEMECIEIPEMAEICSELDLWP